MNITLFIRCTSFIDVLFINVHCSSMKVLYQCTTLFVISPNAAVNHAAPIVQCFDILYGHIIEIVKEDTKPARRVQSKAGSRSLFWEELPNVAEIRYLACQNRTEPTIVKTLLSQQLSKSNRIVKTQQFCLRNRLLYILKLNYCILLIRI